MYQRPMSLAGDLLTIVDCLERIVSSFASCLGLNLVFEDNDAVNDDGFERAFESMRTPLRKQTMVTNNNFIFSNMKSAEGGYSELMERLEMFPCFFLTISVKKV